MCLLAKEHLLIAGALFLFSKERSKSVERKGQFQLPTFDGCTVDARLKQFRKVIPGHEIEFIEFDSQRGMELLSEMRKHVSFLNEV